MCQYEDMERLLQTYTALLYSTLLLTQTCVSMKMSVFKSSDDGLNPDLAPYITGVKKVSGYAPCANYCLTQACFAFFYDNEISSCQLFSKYMSAPGTANGKLFYVAQPPLCEDGQPSEDCLSNVALGKMVSTSTNSHLSIAPPSLLVDGDTDQRFPCLNTLVEMNPWLLVDLGQSFTIWELHLCNRQDPCCVDRLGDVLVSLGADAQSLQDIYDHDGTYIGAVLVVPVNMFLRAQFVKVTLNGTDVHMLGLCEMEVFGQL